MEENQQENANSDYPDTSEISSFSSEENPIHSNSEQVNPNDTNSDSSNKQCYTHPKIEINCTQDDNGAALKAAKKANRLSKESNKYSRRGFWANVIVSIATLVAVFVAIDANRITRNTITEAREKDQKAEVRERYLDSINFVRDTTNTGLTRKSIEAQQLALMSSDIMNKQSLEIAYKSLNAQIKALENSDRISRQAIEAAQQSLAAQIKAFEANQNQFTILNDPFFEIDTGIVLNIKKDTLVRLDYVIRNLNKYPARIVYMKEFFFLEKDSANTFKRMENYISVAKIPTPLIYGKYVSVDHPFVNSYGSITPEDYSTEGLRAFEKGEKFFYYGGFFIYENLANGTFKIYKLIMKIDKNETSLLANNNIEFIKPKN